VACALAIVATSAAVASAALSTVRVTSGLARPIFATSPPGDATRLFVAEQHSGRIRILDLGDGSIAGTDFLTIGGLATGDEQGLLGLAFHPDYATNGYFFVNLTVTGGDTEIRRYQVSPDPDVANPDSVLLVLGYSQPQTNHNGGWLAFGPDEYLYVSSGDGGGGNDSAAGHTAAIGNAQDLTNNLLGKLLRIDVDGDDFPGDGMRNYAIPPDNPFVDATGDDEIWSYGLRNPWRASFDRATGDLYVGDVGQNAREEIDVQPAGSAGGQNYGWRLREGRIATPSGGVGGNRPPGAIDPIYDYTHGSGSFQGFSVSGGYVYRGPIAEIQGHYFFADYVSERIWSLVWDGSDPADFDGTNWTGLTDRTGELATGQHSIDEISSFAEDALGNLYVLDLGGEIFRIVSAGVSTTTVTNTTATSTTTSTTLPGEATLLPGRKLRVKQTKAGTQRLVMVVKDAALAAPVPCTVDGELVIEALGAGGGVRRIPLLAQLWKPLKAKRPERGCKYRRGPIAMTVLVKAGTMLKVVARGDDLGVPLATDPRPVRIEVRHGAARHCVEFGGEKGKHEPNEKLIAKRAATATECPGAAVPIRRLEAAPR
jgi:glucose/arabinose dehydrogenase